MGKRSKSSRRKPVSHHNSDDHHASRRTVCGSNQSFAECCRVWGKVLKLLKIDWLLRTYYRNELRGLRLTAHAKKLLSAEYPNWFSTLFTGDTTTSTSKYTLVHRLRLHRTAEVLMTMLNAGVTVPLWEKLVVLSPTPLTDTPYIDRPTYYSSREVKNLGLMANKIRGSRAAGVLLTDGVIVVYNTGASEMKWEIRPRFGSSPCWKSNCASTSSRNSFRVLDKAPSCSGRI